MLEADLKNERDKLKARLREIDRELARLAPTDRPARLRAAFGKGWFAPAQVGIKLELDAPTVAALLYRLRKIGRLEKSGGYYRFAQ